jgi:hypothetical protein
MGIRLKTIKDIVDRSHNAYKGKFWNRYIKKFQRWDELLDWEKDFEIFCSRMWLDNEDENLTLPAAGNRLSKYEYINKYENWLVKQYENTRIQNNNNS